MQLKGGKQGGQFPVGEIDASRGRHHKTTYWSGNQGQVWIGPYLVDEVVGIGYKITQNKIPVYGYASQYFDAVADGKVLVTGWITINYVDSGYLFHALNKYVQRTYDTTAVRRNPDASPRQARQLLYGSGGYVQKLLNELEQSNKQDPWAQPSIPLMKKISRAIGEQTIGKEALIGALRERYWGTAEDYELTDVSLTGNLSVDDIKYGRVNKANDRAKKGYLRQARPDQMPAISITVSHGDPLDAVSSTYRILAAVHFMSCEKNVTASDDPQTETYTFIARSVHF